MFPHLLHRPTATDAAHSTSPEDRLVTTRVETKTGFLKRKLATFREISFRENFRLRKSFSRNFLFSRKFSQKFSLFS
jgi:hypothetical protein